MDLNLYTAQEAANVIALQSDKHHYSLQEALNVLAGQTVDKHHYSIQEALKRAQSICILTQIKKQLAYMQVK